MSDACLICGGDTAVYRRDLFDDRYGCPGMFTARRCVACGHIAVDATQAPPPAELYTRYYPRRELRVEDWAPACLRGGWRGWLAGERSVAMAWVRPGGSVLDIGCGWGASLGYYATLGCRAVGIDPDANSQRVAAAHGLTIRHGIFSPELCDGERFDTVVLDQVLEHVADPVSLLRQVALVLAPGGRLIIATPNAGGLLARCCRRRWIHWHVPYHVTFFSRRSMALAARAAGLRVRWWRNLTCTPWGEYQAQSLIGRSAPGTPSAFWGHRSEGRFFRRLVAVTYRFTGVGWLLTRLADGLHLGDNQLWCLESASLSLIGRSHR